uniref:hypothetical protein n=1 Tax=Sphingomonas sp. TaxID=28214 RepID=UPI0025D71432|nr:hypothetical protein [Sphingomonas sp.]
MPLNAIKTFTIGPATGREGIAGLEIAVAGIESAARQLSPAIPTVADIIKSRATFDQW